ncbi:platelet glycoprotein Ib alpha chain-like [Mytilus edulis]|uniref:platelet glycoprotein Ib alpha chain-like n=1 Tax=Mytilus edulis TaxID=6550 RepID=UPI0039EFCB87
MQAYFTATPQPAVVQPTSQSTQPLPVISTPSSMVQPTSQSTQPLPVTITPSYMMQPSFTGTPQPAAVQSTSQFSHPLPVTISPSSLWQQYLTETVSPQPTAGQSTTQSAQQVPVPINPTTMEKDDIPTSDHSRVLKAPSSPPPIVEGSDPERPWMDGDKRRVEFRKKLHYNPLEKFK